MSEVLVAPGNAGTAARAEGAQRAPSRERLRRAARPRARQERVALTVVGPEVPLVGGHRRPLRAAGLKCFGPRGAGAQLEGLEGVHEGIPGAPPDSDRGLPGVHGLRGRARLRARTRTPPIVIKADGLAAGKGVIIAADASPRPKPRSSACCAQRQFGAGRRNRRHRGFSRRRGSELHRVVDGTRVVPLASSQDHKTRDDGDRGPEHGRHGRVFAGARRDARGPRARHARHHAADGARARRRRHPLPRLPLCRSHDRRCGPRRASSSSTAGSAIPRRSRSCFVCAPTSSTCA